jgi:hypothetical protein
MSKRAWIPPHPIPLPVKTGRGRAWRARAERQQKSLSLSPHQLRERQQNHSPTPHELRERQQKSLSLAPRKRGEGWGEGKPYRDKHHSPSPRASGDSGAVRGNQNRTTKVDLRLTNRKAIISGANRGIGRSIALAYAAEGIHLAVLGRNKPACIELAQEIAQKNPQIKCVAVHVDLEEPASPSTQLRRDRLARADGMSSCRSPRASTSSRKKMPKRAC